MPYQVTSLKVLNQVIFKEYADAQVARKFASLFPGLGYAAGYKVRVNWRVLLQRLT